MRAYLEHINLTVTDLEEAVRFLQTAFPGFVVRGEGGGDHGDWKHVGDEETYISISKGEVETLPKDNSRNGFNHAGFVVEDVAALAERLLEAGYQRSYPVQNQRYRIRDYFIDADGNEYEFVQYLSDRPEERNDYSD